MDGREFNQDDKRLITWRVITPISPVLCAFEITSNLNAHSAQPSPSPPPASIYSQFTVYQVSWALTDSLGYVKQKHGSSYPFEFFKKIIIQASNVCVLIWRTQIPECIYQAQAFWKTRTLNPLVQKQLNWTLGTKGKKNPLEKNQPPRPMKCEVSKLVRPADLSFVKGQLVSRTNCAPK